MPLFKSQPSILLAYDRVHPENAEEVLEQIDEVKKYYRCLTIPEFIEKRKSNSALIVFENPRKGAFLHVLPVLIADKVSFTLFLRPECIGTNRLPTREESPERRDEGCLGSPLDYFTTWGKIKEFPPTGFDIGINVEGRDLTAELIRQDLDFIEKQLNRRPEVALWEPSAKLSLLKEVGIRAIVTAREGTIDAKTSLYDLPRYRLKKKD